MIGRPSPGLARRPLRLNRERAAPQVLFDIAAVVPDPGKTIAEGAVLPWNSGGRRLSMYAAGELGVRLDVPYRSLTSRERDIVLRGEPIQQQVTLSGRNGRTVQLSVNYDNAVAAVERSLRSNNERTRRLVQCAFGDPRRARGAGSAGRLGVIETVVIYR